MRTAPSRTASRYGLILGVGLLLCRLPFLSHPIPVHPDEVAFMQGLGFPAAYPVHPPGYALWIATGTLLHAIGADPYTAFQAWSLLASVAGPLVFFELARRPLGDTPAWWLALAFGVNPLLWFQATTALTYPTACLLGLLMIGLCLRVLEPGTAHLASARDRVLDRAVIMAAAVLAVGLFVRPDLLIYLGPLLAFVVWRSGLRTRIIAGAILLMSVAAWFWVTRRLYAGGAADEIASRFTHTRDVVLGTSVFRLGLVDGLLRNLVKIVLNLGWDFGVAAILLPWAAGWTIRKRRQQPQLAICLLLWIVPGLLFLLMMHVVQGHFLLLLPAGYLMLGMALRDRCKTRTTVRIIAAIAICSAAQFLFYPWSAETPVGPTHDTNPSGLARFKRLLDAKIAFQSGQGLLRIDERSRIHQQGDYWRTGAHDTAAEQADPLRE